MSWSDSLIRISTYEVDELQKRLKEVLDRQDAVEQAIDTLDLEAEEEKLRASVDPSVAWCHPDYLKAWKLRRARLEAQLTAITLEAEGARDALAEAYEALKKVEHVAELARVMKDDGTVFFLTPNATADFENPFHVHLFEPTELRTLLSKYFSDVTVQGMDAVPHVKADFTARRVKAQKVLKFDVFDLRHKIPRSWYIGFYTRALPIAYRLIARGDSGGMTGITAEDFFVTDDLDTTTMVLFATASKPRRTS